MCRHNMSSIKLNIKKNHGIVYYYPLQTVADLGEMAGSHSIGKELKETTLKELDSGIRMSGINSTSLRCPALFSKGAPNLKK